MATLDTLEARTTILSLPPEILDMIARQLRWRNASWISDMGSSILACKTLRSRFQPFFFFAVSLNERKLERFSNRLAENPDLCGYVRRATIEFLGNFEEDMAELFCAVAFRLTRLRSFEVNTDGSEAEIWEGVSSSFRKSLRSILTSTTLTSIWFTGNITLIVPPCLLFSSPTIKTIILCFDPKTYRDMRYWAKLDAAASSEAAESFPNPTTRCRKLEFSPDTGGRDRSNWLTYVVSTHPKHLLHLSDLAVYAASPFQLRSLQTLLYSLRRKLRRLLLCPENQRLDLSRNRGLRSLTLVYHTHFPYNGLSVIQDTLSGLNAPFLREISLTLTWACPGPAPQRANFPQLYLRELDACFARISGRHPRLESVHLCMTFAHCPGEHPTCLVWKEFYPGHSEADSVGQRYFPFLCHGRPNKLRVRFMDGLAFLSRR